MYLTIALQSKAISLSYFTDGSKIVKQAKNNHGFSLIFGCPVCNVWDLIFQVSYLYSQCTLTFSFGTFITQNPYLKLGTQKMRTQLVTICESCLTQTLHNGRDGDRFQLFTIAFHFLNHETIPLSFYNLPCHSIYIL